MKPNIILLTILLVFFNCNLNERPEFLEIENINLLNSSTKFITFRADAKFINPNIIGGKLHYKTIHVFINEREIATLAGNNFEIPAKKEFTLPVIANIPVDSIFKENHLNGLIRSILSKKIKIRFKGDIIYEIIGFSHTYTIDKTNFISLK